MTQDIRTAPATGEPTTGQKPSIGRVVHYVLGTHLTGQASGEIHAGEGTGGGRTAGKELPAIITRVSDPGDPQAQPPRPPKIDINVLKNDMDEDFPEVGQSTVIVKDVPLLERPDDENQWAQRTAHFPERV